MWYATCLLLLLAGAVFSAEPVYTWRYRADAPDRAYLYRDGKQIGGWCYRAKRYRPLDGESWGQPSEASPVQPPERNAPVVRICCQSSPRRRGLRGRIDDAIGEAALAYVAPQIADVIAKAVIDGMKSIAEDLYPDLYLFDVTLSARLLAYIEMGGKLDNKADTEDSRAAKQVMTKGSARLFLSERAKFIERLTKEKFSNPALAKIYFDVEDDNPRGLELIGWDPEDKLPSRLLFNADDWREDPKTAAADTPAVLMFINRRAKDAKEKIPVTVHCSFVFTAQKGGKAFDKTMSFDLYLEKLEPQKGEAISYPWKVRNVQYK